MIEAMEKNRSIHNMLITTGGPAIPPPHKWFNQKMGGAWGGDSTIALPNTPKKDF